MLQKYLKMMILALMLTAFLPFVVSLGSRLLGSFQWSASLFYLGIISLAVSLVFFVLRNKINHCCPKQEKHSLRVPVKSDI
jgi:phosphoglycerol transferase MdoB-like AlkP superfamily enzyme